MYSNREPLIKSKEDILRIAEAGAVIRGVFAALYKLDFIGLSTLDIDTEIERSILTYKARPSFKTIPNYKHASCISINSEVVHGIPHKKRVVREGDLVKIDIGVVKNGYFADACRTFAVGKISDEAKRLRDLTQIALCKGIESLLPGNSLSLCGRTIEEFANRHGLAVMKEFTGHGVGYALHEPPVVFHYYDPSYRVELLEGMVLAVEPVLTAGDTKVYTSDDEWTICSVENSLSAQFEDTVVITSHGPKILT